MSPALRAGGWARGEGAGHSLQAPGLQRRPLRPRRPGALAAPGAGRPLGSFPYKGGWRLGLPGTGRGQGGGPRRAAEPSAPRKVLPGLPRGEPRYTGKQLGGEGEVPDSTRLSASPQSATRPAAPRAPRHAGPGTSWTPSWRRAAAATPSAAVSGALSGVLPFSPLTATSLPPPPRQAGLSLPSPFRAQAVHLQRHRLRGKGSVARGSVAGGSVAGGSIA